MVVGGLRSGEGARPTCVPAGRKGLQLCLHRRPVKGFRGLFVAPTAQPDNPTSPPDSRNVWSTKRTAEMARAGPSRAGAFSVALATHWMPREHTLPHDLGPLPPRA